jgi:hypothetical protein
MDSIHSMSRGRGWIMLRARQLTPESIVTANYRQRSVSVLLGKGKGMFQPAINTSRGLRGYQGKWIPAPLE